MISELDAIIARTEYARNYYWGYHDCGRLLREAEARLATLTNYRAHALAYGE